MRWALVVLVVCAACEPDEARGSRAKGPDGRSAWLVDCSGQYLSRHHCHERFRKLCGKRGGDVLEDTPHGLVVRCHPKEYE